MKMTTTKTLAAALTGALMLGTAAYAGGPKGAGMGGNAWPAASGNQAQTQTQTRSQIREQTRTQTRTHAQDGQANQGLNDQWIREQAQAQNRFEMRTRTMTSSKGE